jgi:hypothetical protein
MRPEEAPSEGWSYRQGGRTFGPVPAGRLRDFVSQAAPAPPGRVAAGKPRPALCPPCDGRRRDRGRMRPAAVGRAGFGLSLLLLWPGEVVRLAGDVVRRGKIGNPLPVPVGPTRLTGPHTPATASAAVVTSYAAYEQPRRRQKHPNPGHCRRPGGVDGPGTGFA